MSTSRLFKLTLMPVLAAGLLWTVPAAAQFSASYKFLEAVRKREGQSVTDMLDKGGPTLINTRDSTTGETALHIATARRDRPWMEFFIAKGANVNARDAKGQTALVIATNFNFVEGAELLVARGARLDDSNNAGETPLITAVHNHNIALMRILLKSGANPDRADNSGRSARDYAKIEGKGGTLLAEIDANAKTAKQHENKPSYGPQI